MIVKGMMAREEVRKTQQSTARWPLFEDAPPTVDPNNKVKNS